MAITDNSISVVTPPIEGNEWAVSAYSTDFSSTESLKAAVTGKTHYIKRITIHCASAITVSIGGGETSDALTTTYLGPIPFTTSGPRYELDFKDKAMKLLISTALCIDASGSGAAAVYVEGKTA